MQHTSDPVQPGTSIADPLLSGETRTSTGEFINWGTCRFEIGRDGSYARVIPDRSMEGSYGCHINAVKLLEVSPGQNCITVSNVHPLDNGDVSIDVKIKHPYDNAICTGFDVRGVIMFPSSQLYPDNELLISFDLEPADTLDWWKYADHEKGDAELMNPDGWTTVWSITPLQEYRNEFACEEGFPIFFYFPGQFATGEDLGTINAFKRFYSNENRHMFEKGATVTRTYIIRPPASGPIYASYAVYAHWAPPDVTPVVNPAVDFPPEANSMLPYEFYIWQEQIIDPDAPPEVRAQSLHWHLKSWYLDTTEWGCYTHDLLDYGNTAYTFEPHPSGIPDDYSCVQFSVNGYEQAPYGLPGEWPYIFRILIWDPDKPYTKPIAAEYYLMDVNIDAPDGSW